MKEDGHGHKYLPFSLYAHKQMYDNKIKMENLSRFKLPDPVKYTVDTNCVNKHLSWPRGSCTRCLPQSDFLHHQRFRLVDSVVFNCANTADRFLSKWRKSGSQQIGFLIGTYEKSKASQFLLQARVYSIYQPTQVNSLNFVELIGDPEKDVTLKFLLQHLKMQIVGVILTDLIQDVNDDGQLQLKNYRNDVINVSNFF